MPTMKDQYPDPMRKTHGLQGVRMTSMLSGDGAERMAAERPNPPTILMMIETNQRLRVTNDRLIKLHDQLSPYLTPSKSNVLDDSKTEGPTEAETFLLGLLNEAQDLITALQRRIDIIESSVR